MDKRVVIGVVVAVAVLAGLPLAPKLLSRMRGPDFALDAANQERIERAIQAYGQSRGHYPPTLSDLAPAHLDAVPLTSTGKAFAYNAQDGSVRNPDAPAETETAPQRAKGGQPIGGAGPMGETMTGIGIMDELN